MNYEIKTIKMGYSNIYTIFYNGIYMFIDTGKPLNPSERERFFKSLDIDYKKVFFIMITHSHYDHTGNVKYLKNLSDAKVICHKNGEENLRFGKSKGVDGTNLISKFILKFVSGKNKTIKIDPVEVDFIIDKEVFDLNEIGFIGKVLYTPGHTDDSISLLLPEGETFVGDLLMNIFPLAGLSRIPVIGEDKNKIKESVNFLKKNGAKIVYPGHGMPFKI
jgi:glyoxylase-like metal-dependent hydrolase (beta-lactamase superfamily II)